MHPLTLLPIALLACTGLEPSQAPRDEASAVQIVEPSPPAAPAGLDLGPSGSPVRRLREHLSSATIRLPDQPTPASRFTGGSFTLDVAWRQEEQGRAWSCPSPIDLPHASYRSRPPGVTLQRGQDLLPYAPATSTKPVQIDGWEVERGRVWITAVEDPSGFDPPLVLRDQATRAREQRLDPSRSGLAPAEWAAWRTTLDNVTRDVVLMPTPTTITFPEAAPDADALLRFGYGLSAHGESTAMPDAMLSVWADDQLVWSTSVSERDSWSDVEIPIPAGTNNLMFGTTSPAKDPTEWVLLAEPELVRAEGTPSGPRRVVVVGLDTLRPDHLSRTGYPRPTSPGLDALARESVVYEQTWAPAPRTRPSFRTLLTGRWPLEAIGAPTLAELLSAEGFSTGGIVANVHFMPHLGLSDGFRYWHYRDSADAGPQTDVAMQWLTSHQNEDSLLFLHLMDPHVFYMAPEGWTGMYSHGLNADNAPERYNRWLVKEWQQEGRLSEATKEWIEARYDEEIAYLDHELTSFVREVDTLPGRTMFVFVSDHGEEFWEHGGFEHNHSLHEEVTRAVLWIRPPGGRAGGAVVQTPASLADVTPTILDALSISRASRPPFDGTSLHWSENEAPTTPAERHLPLGHMMFSPEQWGVVSDGHKYLLTTGSGSEALYDLGTDPTETHNIAARPSTDLSRWRETLATATGYPVTTGWRLLLQGVRAPFELTFDEPVDSAWVIDPEALRNRRANLEWGEVPTQLAADVAEVRVGVDKKTVYISPGRDGRGVLAVSGPSAQATARTATQVVRPGDVARLGGAPVTASAGALIRPNDTEARRLAGTDDSDAINALRSMGYIE